jgi:hypothetical protein
MGVILLFSSFLFPLLPYGEDSDGGADDEGIPIYNLDGTQMANRNIKKKKLNICM